MSFVLGAIILIMLAGLVLVAWPHRYKDAATQVAFGASLATGAVVSLAFYALQNENQANQDRLARKQTLQLSIALQRDLTHVDLRNRDLRHLDLAGRNLSGADLRGADLRGDDLTSTNLSGAALAGADLQRATLTDANLAGARMQGVDLRNALMRRTNLTGALVGGPPGRTSPHARLGGARLLDARLSGACMAHADMRKAQFGGADLGNAVLTGADLRGALLQVDGVFANLRHVAGIGSARLDARSRATLPRAVSAPVQAPAPVPADARAGRIAEVSDGDTLRLASGQWVRLVGVNAWVTEEPEGRRAAQFLRRLQRLSPDIRFTLGDPADESFRDKINPPGRLRAFVWLSDGTFLNGMLLAGGYADRQYPNPGHGEDPTEGGYTAIFNQALDHARDGGRGVWSTCPRLPSARGAPTTTGAALVATALLPATTRARAAWPAAPDRGIRRSSRAAQPVGGLSALVSVGPRAFLSLTDNGFGKRANSKSFLLRIYRLRADFRTRDGGARELHVQSVVTLRDPHHLVPFTISTAGTTNRLLTGGDFDPESLVQGRHGELWIGDEFGPYILHVDKRGALLEPPIPLPGVKSPDNVLPIVAKSPVTLGRSEGIEGLAVSPTGESLYAILEGPLRTEVDPRRRMVFEYDAVEGRFTQRRWEYRVAAQANSVSDLAAVDADHLLVLEKTGPTATNPPAARFARVFDVDLQHTDRQGYLQKQQVVDLLDIKDPHRLSVTGNQPGPGAVARYAVPAGVESIVKLGAHEIGVINDNNVSGGRAPGPGDDSDLAVIAVPQRFGA